MNKHEFTALPGKEHHDDGASRKNVKNNSHRTPILIITLNWSLSPQVRVESTWGVKDWVKATREWSMTPRHHISRELGKDEANALTNTKYNEVVSNIFQ